MIMLPLHGQYTAAIDYRIEQAVLIMLIRDVFGKQADNFLPSSFKISFYATINIYRVYFIENRLLFFFTDLSIFSIIMQLNDLA